MKWAPSSRRKAYHAEYNAARRGAVAMLKLEAGCVDCGYDTAPEALDFDHVGGGKTAGVAALLGMHASWSRILDEIDKCVVRCANCHRIRTTRAKVGV